jgi:hypothetical protein
MPRGITPLLHGHLLPRSPVPGGRLGRNSLGRLPQANIQDCEGSRDHGSLPGGITPPRRARPPIGLRLVLGWPPRARVRVSLPSNEARDGKGPARVQRPQDLGRLVRRCRCRHFVRLARRTTSRACRIESSWTLVVTGVGRRSTRWLVAVDRNRCAGTPCALLVLRNQPIEQLQGGFGFASSAACSASTRKIVSGQEGVRACEAQDQRYCRLSFYWRSRSLQGELWRNPRRPNNRRRRSIPRRRLRLRARPHQQHRQRLHQH